MRKKKSTYHHGNLAESLLDAVDEIASQFGHEAVTLRACAKLIGVSPSSAFRHYTDKRALMTAFATRALKGLTDTLATANQTAADRGEDPLMAVSLAYIRFALNKPAFFRAMWNDETLYAGDEHYMAATDRLAAQLMSGFANTIEDQDPEQLSAEELLVWSALHGLANLFVDGPLGRSGDTDHKLVLARDMVSAMRPVLLKSDAPTR